MIFRYVIDHRHLLYNGKIVRWFQEYNKHRHRFNTAQEFVEWYNNRIHWSLKLEWGETPNEAFVRKLRPEVILGLFIRNIEGGENYDAIQG